MNLHHTMAKGSKSSYTQKQKRQAEHIEEGYEAQGVSRKTAEARAWATVNKTSGGGKKSGSGRASPTKKTAKKATAKKAAGKTARKSATKKTPRKKASR